MSQVNLRKLLARKEVAPIVVDLLAKLPQSISIQDPDGRHLMGDADARYDYEQAIDVAGETVGWVKGGDCVSTIAELISYLSNSEVEKKRLASEVLDRYKEINLFYQLSEKITASLELPVVGALIIEEARKLIKTTSGSVMLLNNQTGMLEILSGFGTASTAGFALKPGDGIAGSVFLTGKGEIVNDVANDSRFVPGKNPVQALVCAPLKTRNRVIGVVNFSHHEAIAYSAADLQLLSTLASQAAQAIENAQLHETQIKDAVARNEIEKGQKMQRDFLPDRLEQPNGWDLASTFMPARQVAGDFYDTFKLPSGGIGLVIADVCDKGVGSALFMALFRSLIRVFSLETSPMGMSLPMPSPDGSNKQLTINLDFVNPLRAVRLTNDYVAENHSNLNMFATLFFGVLDPKTGILTYINGGHEPLIVLNENGIKTQLKSTGPAVGMLPNMNFRVQQVYLEKGDILMGYTDGVPEAKSPDGKFFTEHRLMELLESHKGTHSASALLQAIEIEVLEHIDDAAQFDDITMLAVYRIP